MHHGCVLIRRVQLDLHLFEPLDQLKPEVHECDDAAEKEPPGHELIEVCELNRETDRHVRGGADKEYIPGIYLCSDKLAHFFDASRPP